MEHLQQIVLFPLLLFLSYVFVSLSLSFFLSSPPHAHIRNFPFPAFWLQGPATAGSFVPPPSALSPPPSSAPPTHGHLSHFSFPTSSSSSSSPPSSLTLGIGTSTPVPPARTYAAAHRLQQPFSEEQFRLKLLHRNQTIVEVHSQPGGHDEGGGGGGSGFDADVDMQLYTPPAPPLLSSSSSSSTCKPLSVVPEHGDGGGRAANVVVKSGGTAPMVAPVTTPVRPTTLNLCSGCFCCLFFFLLFFYFSFELWLCSLLSNGMFSLL